MWSSPVPPSFFLISHKSSTLLLWWRYCYMGGGEIPHWGPILLINFFSFPVFHYHMARYVGHSPPHPSSPPPQTLLLSLGKEGSRKSPLTSSSSSGAKSRGKNFNWSSSSLAEEVCVKEGWKKKEEKESLFMGVSQKKVLSPFLFRAGASTTSFIK